MPLHDHFRPPMSEHLAGTPLHHSWASEIACRLNRHRLRRPFRAREHYQHGSELEIDIAAQEQRPTAQVVAPALFPDEIEIRIYDGPGSWHLVGAMELISRSNKNTPERREAFVCKCATYLRAGVSVVLVDVVTDRHANLHNQLLDLLSVEGGRMADPTPVYASANRPIKRGGRDEMDIWFSPCTVGTELPTMPLRLTGDLFVPIEMELTYDEVLQRHEVN